MGAGGRDTLRSVAYVVMCGCHKTYMKKGKEKTVVTTNTAGEKMLAVLPTKTRRQMIPLH